MGARLMIDLDDQSWENPYDVAKGHRGFIDGDFIMMMYAWSPNWKANSVGNDHYNLYARRSFDGGATWTTTPAAFGWCMVQRKPVKTTVLVVNSRLYVRPMEQENLNKHAIYHN